MTLGSLSSDGWGCVTILLVVWPEAFQHWNLQVFGWGRVFVLKWGPLGDQYQLSLISIPWGLHYQCPCPHSELQPTFASPWGPPRPLGRSRPCSYRGTALCWVPVHVRPCVHPPRVDSLFPPACGAPTLKPHWPSRLNALGVLPPNPRPSDCLGVLFLCGNAPVWPAWV